MMNVLKELLADFDEITETKLNRAALKLEPFEASEKLLAVIEDAGVRKMWALGIEYRRRSQLAEHARQFDAGDKAEREALEAEANRWGSMSEIARNLAWHEMKVLAGPVAWVVETVALREGWALVSSTSSEDEVHGFALPIPSELIATFRKMMGARQEIEQLGQAEPKKKPQ